MGLSLKMKEKPKPQLYLSYLDSLDKKIVVILEIPKIDS